MPGPSGLPVLLDGLLAGLAPLHGALMAAYAVCAAVLALHGLHVAALALLALRAPVRTWPVPPDAALPHVTVQLPLYNEADVAARLLGAVAAFDYPRFDVQVLDDSTDATTAVVAEAVAGLRARGLHVHHLRRATREGFKAGALAHGLARTRAPFVAVFDADFVPPPGLLRCLVTPLLADARAAFSQARWTHRNARSSLLTRVQAAALDAHFATEQHGRAAAGLVFTFNGTAGLWRRAALEDAGGWRGGALAEDFDLSVRAYACGWHGVFLDDAPAPADLPADLHALRAQQRRWARGTAEVARRCGRTLLTSAALPRRVRALAALHLATPLTFGAGLGLVLLYAPTVLAGGLPPLVQALGLAGVGGVAAQHLATARRRGEGVARGLARTVAVAAGLLALVPACALAVAEALGARPGVFERTAKSARYRTPRPRALVAVETACLAYALAGLGAMAAAGYWAWMPFQALVALAFGWAAWHNARPSGRGVRSARKPVRPDALAAPDRTLAPSVYVTPPPRSQPAEAVCPP